MLMISVIYIYIQHKNLSEPLSQSLNSRCDNEYQHLSKSSDRSFCKS